MYLVLFSTECRTGATLRSQHKRSEDELGSAVEHAGADNQPLISWSVRVEVRGSWARGATKKFGGDQKIGGVKTATAPKISARGTIPQQPAPTLSASVTKAHIIPFVFDV